jgi:hypothetical protein
VGTQLGQARVEQRFLAERLLGHQVRGGCSVGAA